jgi:hypothetical protein
MAPTAPEQRWKGENAQHPTLLTERCPDTIANQRGGTQQPPGFLSSRWVQQRKQEMNSSETSCDRVGGLKKGVVKKPVSAWWKEVWLKSKLQQSGNKSGQKIYFSMAGDWAIKIKI